MNVPHDPAPDNTPRKKTRKTIGELVRQRYFVNGEMFDRDLVIALADHEEVLLRRLPYLAGWTRSESALPGLLIFTPPSVEKSAVVPALGGYQAPVGLN